MSADARTLRDLVDDLADRLEKTGVDDTKLGPAYMRISLRDAKGRADELIEALAERAGGAEAETREAIASLRESEVFAESLQKEVTKLTEELAELKRTGMFPVPTIDSGQLVATPA